MSASTALLAWGHRAEEDGLLARAALRRKVSVLDGATFQAQPCVEKDRTARLVSRREACPRARALWRYNDLQKPVFTNHIGHIMSVRRDVGHL